MGRRQIVQRSPPEGNRTGRRCRVGRDWRLGNESPTPLPSNRVHKDGRSPGGVERVPALRLGLGRRTLMADASIMFLMWDA